MKKVFFTIPSLEGGGAEKVILYILKYLDKKKYTPVLILFEKKGQFIDNLPEDIAVYSLNKEKLLKGFRWLILLRLARLLNAQKPDVIVSFMWYANMVTILARYLSRVKCGVVISERYSLEFSLEGWLTEFLRRFTISLFYPKADKIIVNSVKMGFQLSQTFKILPTKITVIYNPIDIGKVIQAGLEEDNHPRYKEDIPIIIAIGRLTNQKGFSYLISAISLLSKNGIDCKLVILGEGAEEKNLHNLSKELSIEDGVRFLGFKSNPYKYLARSKIFVLSSLYEGFPNVLLEAMALGVPSIATRCPTGPEEIITDGVDGLLIPVADEKALENSIKKLLMDKDLRERLSEAARKRAEDFRVEKIIKQYEDVIEGSYSGH